MKIVYTFTNSRSAFYRAIMAIILGVVLVVWPGAAQRYIIMFIGAIFLAIGLMSFIVSYRNRVEHPRSVGSFSGAGSIILGLLLLGMPSVFVMVFMYVLGFILVLAAVGQFASLSALRQLGNVSPVSYVFPVLILIAGLVVLFNPFHTAEGVFILFGLTSVFYGVTDLINQYSLKRMRKANEDKEKIVRMGGVDVIEDADYEEIPKDDERI